MEFLVVLSISLFALISICVIGGLIERAHLRSLKERESYVKDVLLSTLDAPSVAEVADHPPTLVTGEVVISSDYFKNWLFSLRNIFGGESHTFTRLFDRARREAVLRMIAEAKQQGYNAICNVRFGSADIGGNASTNGKKKTLKMAACMVSGTAYCKR